MATQGLITIVDKKDKKTVLYKIIAGCNGHNITKLIDSISKLKESISIYYLYEKAKEVSFGCEECLIVLSKKFGYIDGLEIPQAYRETFNKIGWNPRWKHGTADYNEVIYV